MDKLIFATGNAGKMKEIREILGRPGLTILSQKKRASQVTPRKTEPRLRPTP